jgi:hypothetical protein
MGATMSEGQAEKPFNPFEQFRGVRDAYLDAMSKAMIETVNTESYANASGAMLDGYLTVSAPFRESLDKAMIHALEQLSLPSRQEVASLAERFTHVETRLDDLDAKLDRIAALLAAAPPKAARKPKPAAKKPA